MNRAAVNAFLARLHDATRPPLVMGVLNLTPDSFSDGGQLVDTGRPHEFGRALAAARRMVAAGADLLDLGGESTRPGAQPVDEDEEMGRVLPLLRALARDGIAWLSVDTQRAALAGAAVEAGAVLVNDISAGRRDPALWPLVARCGVPTVVMHMQGTPATMQVAPHYQDAAAEVRGFLVERSRALTALGLPRDRIVVDPGIGFGKRLGHIREVLAGWTPLPGQAMLLGVSRKSFVAALEEEQGQPPAPPGGRLGGSLAAAIWGARRGARILRVHDVAETVQALRVWRWLEDGASWS
jgi:dihydropteroate synthase